MSEKGKTIQVDTKTFIRFWLVILGLALVALFIWKAATGLLIIGIALFLAVAISPLVEKVAKIIPGNKRKVAITISYVIVVAAVGVILAVVVPVIVDETVKFASNLPEMVEEVSGNLGWINDIGDRIGIENLQDQIMASVDSFSSEFVKDLGGGIINSVGVVGSVFAAIILVLFLTFFMLIEGPRLMDAFWEKFGGSPKMVKTRRAVDRMADVVAKFVTGELTIAMINATATAIVVFILSLIFGFSAGLALPLGMLTGVFSFIPMFGSFIGGVLAALLLAFSGWGAGLAFLIYYIIYLQFEANLITPRVQGKGLHMPALLVLVAVTVGVYMWGLLGAIIAIPIVGCGRVLLEEFGAAKKTEKKIEAKT